MCGRCRGVFNAFQSLMRVSDDELGDKGNETDVSALADDPLPGITDALFLREEPRPLSHEFTQTDFASDLKEPVVNARLGAALYEPVIGFDDVPEFVEDSSKAAEPLASLLPDFEENNGAANPLLTPVAGYRQAAKTPRTGLWLTGAMFLFLGLSLQLAYAYRSTVVQSFPQVRPAYLTACEWAGCNLPWGRDESAVRIEASDLIELPGKAGRILLTATLINRSSVRQELPSLELKLTDNANQVIMSRVLQPHEYLGRAVSKDENLAPNVDMYVNLSFELTPKAAASGYGVRAFYP